MSEEGKKEESKSFFQRVFSRYDIFKAIEDGDASLCWKLVCSDPEVLQKTDALGRTSLHLAAFKGNLHIIKTLISKGADIHKVDNNGSTALHWAAAGGNIAVVNELILSGASIHSKDKEGYTPEMIANMRGNIDAALFLKKLAGEK